LTLLTDKLQKDGITGRVNGFFIAFRERNEIRLQAQDRIVQIGLS
jgi:hypothetical protein